MPHPSPVIKEMSSLSSITLENAGISNKRKKYQGGGGWGIYKLTL